MRRIVPISLIGLVLSLVPSDVASAVTVDEPVVANLPVVELLAIADMGGRGITEEPRHSRVSCHVKVTYSFRGTRNKETGNVSGEWYSMYHGETCTVEGTETAMKYMYISSTLRRNNAFYATVPTVSCSNCVRTFETGAGFACSTCNGSYQAHATFELTGPASMGRWAERDDCMTSDYGQTISCGAYGNVVVL